MLAFVSLMGAAREARLHLDLAVNTPLTCALEGCCFVLVGVCLSNLALSVTDRRIGEMAVSHAWLLKTGAPNLPQSVRFQATAY